MCCARRPNKQRRAAVAAWPNVAEFSYPRIKRDEYDSTTPTKLFIHQRTLVALNTWGETMKKNVSGSSIAKCIHLAIRYKCDNVGLNTIEMWRDGKRFTHPVFKRLPHPDTTYDTRSLEERAMAITLALKVLADASLAHGFETRTLPANVASGIERFFAALDTTNTEE